MGGLDCEEEWAFRISGWLRFQSTGGHDNVHVCCELHWHLGLLCWPGTCVAIFILGGSELINVGCIMAINLLSGFLPWLCLTLFLGPLLLLRFQPLSLNFWG